MTSGGGDDPEYKKVIVSICNGELFGAGGGRARDLGGARSHSSSHHLEQLGKGAYASRPASEYTGVSVEA